MKTLHTPVTGKRRDRLQPTIRILLALTLLYFVPVGYSLASYLFIDNHGPWWQLSRESSGQSPDPAEFKEAIIQVYAARAARWRGALGVHTWIAVKPTNAESYTRIEVIGFNVRRYGSSISINKRPPDGYWFGSKPALLSEVRGAENVDSLIQRLYEAVELYPYDGHYRLWPGPNSNTFIAWLGRAIPELQLELPVTAVGKDYVPIDALFSVTPSGTGVQFSLYGVFGLLLGLEEGIEVNMLGFAAGLDLSPPAIKLPGIGRLGFSDLAPVSTTGNDKQT